MRCFFCCLLLLLCSTSVAAKHNFSFFDWSGDDAQKSSDYFAVLDAHPTSPCHGQAVAPFRGDDSSADGEPAVLQQQASGKTHSATLTWKASSSQVAGYNVYRSITSGKNYQRINSSLVRGLTYQDKAVVSGATYYYVTRAVDAQGHESANSNETSVSIP